MPLPLEHEKQCPNRLIRELVAQLGGVLYELEIVCEAHLSLIGCFACPLLRLGDSLCVLSEPGISADICETPGK